MATAAVKTLEDLEALPGEWLTCKQIAPILGAKEANIHMQAMDEPHMLGFPVIIIKSRVKIPRRPFIKFMREGTAE